LGFWSGMPTVSSVMCGAESQAGEALRRIGLVMKLLGLTLYPAKTRRGTSDAGKRGSFSGEVRFAGSGASGVRRASTLCNSGRPKATQKLRDRIRELTAARQSGKDGKQIIAELNPVLVAGAIP
jgi:hypothetical protein